MKYLTKIILGTPILFSFYHISKFAYRFIQKVDPNLVNHCCFQTSNFQTTNITLQFLLFCLFFWGTYNLDSISTLLPLSFKIYTSNISSFIFIEFSNFWNLKCWLGQLWSQKWHLAHNDLFISKYLAYQLNDHLRNLNTLGVTSGPWHVEHCDGNWLPDAGEGVANVRVWLGPRWCAVQGGEVYLVNLV